MEIERFFEAVKMPKADKKEQPLGNLHLRSSSWLSAVSHCLCVCSLHVVWHKLVSWLRAASSLPLLNELRTLRRLRHPNIVLFLGAHVVYKAQTLRAGRAPRAACMAAWPDVRPSTNDMALVFELIEGQTLHVSI